MRKILLILFCAITALRVMAEDRFYINDFSITAGETKQVEIMLDNTTVFTALQADIYLPEGLTVEQEDGDYLFDLTSRKGRDHTISSRMLSSGAIRILIASQNLKTFSGNSGALVTFNIIADPSISGTKVIQLKNVTASEVNQTEHHLPETSCNVSILPPTVLATGITLNKNELSLEVGASEALVATVTPSNVTNGSVTWTSSNTSVATVNSSGLVTAKSTGNAIITATTADGTNYSANCLLTVTPAIVLATGISLNKNELSLEVGASETLIATVTPSNVTNSSVTWTSSNTSIATVSSSGKVTARTTGTATITAKTSDGTNLTATCQVTVTPAAVLATGISLNKTVLTFGVGSTETLIAIVTPSNVTNSSVTWTSSNTSIATVSSSGKVTAKAAGTATITAKTSDGTNLTATCQVTVLAANSVPYSFMDEGIAYNINSDNQTLTITYTDKSNTYANNYQGLVKAIIPASVTHGGVTYTVVAIAEHAFRNCKTLELVTIPITLTSVGTYAFGGCEALDSMSVESGNSVYDSRENCNAIIETATNTLNSGCKATVIPNSVTKIGTFAFYEHHGLETIEIPSSVTEIGRSAFNHMLGLKTIVAPNSVVTLEPYVFSQCYGLEEVTIGSGVTSIGTGLLYGCAAVTSLTSYIDNPNNVTMGTNVFKNMDYENCVLHVPAGTVNIYKEADQWKDFINIVADGAIYGDVNCDGNVTASDVTAIYDILLGNSNAYEDTADVNHDGHITAADITAIYDILLGN